ncbi:hypothetical protein CHK_1926 [Christensenella hongkongensis]|uniref:Uncharacterized protein n=1 Tax=Christensenella hongkongensis TaxID=270498 RepID=A0A0M2NJM5_9FIRM|nr:hypothetical protein CHK_1926 [Christensenella hongkongensis]
MQFIFTEFAKFHLVHMIFEGLLTAAHAFRLFCIETAYTNPGF